MRRLTRAARLVEPCPTGGWPPRLPALRRGSKLRFEPARRVHALVRADDGLRAALGLAAVYRGERTIVLALGNLRAVGDAAVGRLVREAAWLLRGWGPEARIELRSLRPATRRAVLAAAEEQDEVAVLAAGRGCVVLVPAPDERARREAVLAELGATRRKMLRLAERDGEHCVWCRTPLTHRSLHATVDHVRCRSDGGGNSLDNLVLACAPCNHRRSNAPADSWLATCLAAGAEVDVDAVTSAIRRADRRHSARVRAA